MANPVKPRGNSVSSVDGESAGWGAGPGLDSVALLDRLGTNPTESAMAQVALTRAQESIADSFSYEGAGNRVKFDDIPSYTKDQMLLGQHLGKGSFSDVFEVTVTLKEPNSTDRVNALFAEPARKNMTVQVNEKNSSSGQICAGSTNDTDGRRRQGRRHSMSSSICVSSLGNRHESEVTRRGKRVTLAMKCLRPQARSNFEHFLVGVEDLVHETAILSSLEHPNIIKLWGRASDSTPFKLSDGYFILVDRLRDTLQDRIDRWAKDFPNARKNAPSLSQMKVACELSDALSYLHMSNVVFRDLKPVSRPIYLHSSHRSKISLHVTHLILAKCRIRFKRHA
jgi:serine/threonine protein kinase